MLGLLRTRRSVAALEFALLAPTLVMVFAGVVDIGNALYTWSKLEQALALGANYALMNTANVATNTQTLANNIATIAATSNPGHGANATVVVNNGITATVTGTANGAGTPSDSGTASNAGSYYCLTGSPTSWTWGTAKSNNTTACADGSQPGQFVIITVSYSFTPFFASYGFVANGTMTDGAAVQTN
jgi:Flp pilus assembly protein TadG